MIETIIKITIFFTNYSIITSIVKQIFLTSNNIGKFNLRLIKVSTYFFQFDFDIRYKSNKINVVSNALFKLSIKSKN